MGVCLQEFDQMVGLGRFEMIVELGEEVFVLCWHLWVVSLDDVHYWHWRWWFPILVKCSNYWCW